MNKKRVLLLSLFPLFGLALTACFPIGDEGCTKNVTSVATVENLTNRSLSLAVCNTRSTDKHMVVVPANQSGAFTIESHDEPWIKTGGPANACDPEQFKSNLYLTTASFNSVRLCYDPTDASQIKFVELWQPCPAGYQAQMMPVDTCE